jgi:WD40 repeat protein
MCCFSAIAQDYTQFGLPEGAKARLGKGELGKIHFSPDSSRLAVSSSIGIWFYDSQTGEELDLLSYTNGVPPFAFAFAPDGDTIASGTTSEMIVVAGQREARLPSTVGNTVQLRDTTTGEKRTTVGVRTQRVANIVYAPDGNTIATARERGNTVYFWDAATGESKGTLEWIGKGSVQSFVYAPDGNTIATAGSREDNGVQLWDAQTRRHKTTLTTGHTKPVNAIAYSPDGNSIVSGGADGIARLWDVTTGTRKATLKHKSGIISLLPWYYMPINSVVYSPDGNTIATAGWDRKLQLWDIRTTKLTATLAGHTGPVNAVAYSSDGNTIATAGGWGDNTVRLWNAGTGEARTVLTGYVPINAVAYSPDGKMIATSGDYRSRALHLWDAQTKKIKTTYTEHMNKSFSATVYAPDGKTIASVNLSDNTLELWSPETGKHKATFKHANTRRGSNISSVVYSPDGNTIAAVGGHYKDHQGIIYLWHVQTGNRKIIYQGPDYISSVAYSPDGRRIATGSWNGNIQVWHTVTGEALKAISTKHKGGVESLAYSPDGETIASAGGYRDDIVQLWDARTGVHKARLIGHTKTVTSVVYSPDGKTIATGSTDGTVRFWDAMTWEHTTTFTANTDVVSVVYSPDGKTIATRSTDGTVLLWETKPISEDE